MEPHKCRILHYLVNGRSVFFDWLCALPDIGARAAIRTRLDRVTDGNFGDCRPVGEGVWELRVHCGPGYRVYYGEDGPDIVLLLCGGVKRSQRRDITRAKHFWADYRRRR
ncbi:MAG: type II toxin-antitoxin system RelE/ParE family toxin [Elusimicrobiales bacterium]